MTIAGACAPLLRVLREPAQARSLDGRGWTGLLAAARAVNLMGTLAERLQCAGVRPHERIDRHLAGARQLAARQRLSVLWEAHCLQAVLGPLGIPVVLLKGAAYVMGGHDDVARGRMFGDIDILVPREALGDVESALMLDGWASAKVDAYDQRYYREWMHELPPMTHVRRGTVIDIHHTILPPTARNAPDPAAIIARAHRVPGLPALRTPAPEDLLIHSITHLVHEGELHNGLRDLVDIDVMLRRFSAMPGFWRRFVDQATSHDLAAPVVFGLRLARGLLDTPVAADAERELQRTAAGAVAPGWFDTVYRRALQQHAPGGEGVLAASAALFVYIRAHWLRMPPGLLLRHLSRKAWRRVSDRDREDARAEA